MRTFVTSLAVLCTSAFAMAALQSQGAPSLRHVVVFKYKASATPAQISQITAAFRELKDRIPGITSFEHGVNNSPENKNLGFTHVYMLTFTDVKARDAYLPHPEHKKFGDLLASIGAVEDVFVVDYVAQ